MKIIYRLFVTFCITTNAFAMADRTSPVYGVPTLYGEYELSVDDARRASKMYGNAPRPAAIRAGAIKNTPAAKHPVKAKKTKSAAKKKVIKKSKSIPEKQVRVAKQTDAPEQTENIKEVSVATTEIAVTPIVRAVPVASQAAVDIASHVADRVDIDSFCTQRKPQGRGNLPDGIIMMPGRPDLMSCTTPNKD